MSSIAQKLIPAGALLAACGAAQGRDSWGPAFNLGPQVNIAGADMCPALPPGPDTIAWFSSRADNSLGNIDIFWTNKVNVD